MVAVETAVAGKVDSETVVRDVANKHRVRFCHRRHEERGQPPLLRAFHQSFVVLQVWMCAEERGQRIGDTSTLPSHITVVHGVDRGTRVDATT